MRVHQISNYELAIEAGIGTRIIGFSFATCLGIFSIIFPQLIFQGKWEIFWEIVRVVVSGFNLINLSFALILVFLAAILLLLFWLSIMLAKHAVLGHRYVLNRNTGKITINQKHIAIFSHVSHIEIKEKQEEMGTYWKLCLVLNNRERLFVDLSHSKQEMKSIALTLAEFTGFSIQQVPLPKS
jgi:hypothetical protein